MSEELKQEVDRLLENRENEKEKEQEYIKSDVPKDFLFETTEVERLKIENISLKRAMLNNQQEEINKQTEVLFNGIKARAGVPLNSEIKIQLPDVSKVMVCPVEKEGKNGT
jgi:hypothetical protein